MLPQVRKRPGRALTLLAGAAAIVLIGAVIPNATADASGEQWSADLSSISSDDVNVRYADGVLRLSRTTPTASSAEGAEVSGQLITAPVTLDRATSKVDADVDATVPDGTRVTVDVRGATGSVSWTEWVPAGTALPMAADRVQVRITLVEDAGLGDGGLDPTVAGVRLTAAEGATASGDVSVRATPVTYRVYATREGLVGGTTANGHVIKTRDHFVALPSRRGLSANNAGTYTVRACSPATGRCEYAPVWDVGPWNTKDDYWNPSSTREMWKDLPRGKPEAQAAYQDGYNGGLDQFGRRVANPAGIDLADGTFWDGLKLTDNAWVNVTYLWTGTGPTGVVRTSGAPLTVRSSASTGASAVGLAANHANVTIECTLRGSTVTGTYGTSDLWNRIGSGHYVADVYLYTGSDDPVAPAC